MDMRWAVSAMLWYCSKGVLSRLEGRAEQEGAVVGAGYYGQVCAAKPHIMCGTCKAVRQ